MARRVGLGLARTGSYASHGSGEIFVCAATGLRPRVRGSSLSGASLTGGSLDELFAAVVEASEESVLNSLSAATTMHGHAGHAREGLPLDGVAGILASRRA
jgi:D-aminopeptidase